MKRLFLASLAFNLLLLIASGALLFRSSSPVDSEASMPSAAVESSTSASAENPEPEEPALAEVADASEAAPEAASDPLSAIDKIAGLDQDGQVAALVAAGWSAEDAKVFVLGSVMREFAEAGSKMASQENQDYWRSPSMHMDMSWEDQRKIMEMQQKMQVAMQDILGEDSMTLFGNISIPIPDEKQHAAQLIEMDYMMMSQKLHHDAGGILLPEDHEALALLEEAKRRDLEALMTPEEFFEYEIRTSDTARSLRHQLGGMEPTEEEFRAIFRLQRDVDLAMQGMDPTNPETQQRKEEASEEMEDELKEMLGEERFRQYERSQDWSYGRLIAVTERLDLPRERADEVYDVKEYAEHQRQALRSDDLSDEERQAAIETLNEETRADLVDLLGEEGFELYQQNGGHWIHQIR